MATTKLKNGQLPDTISSKTVDNTNDINTTTTRLKITGGSNGQVLSTDGSGNLSWTTAGGGGGISDGDKGDVTVSGSGTTWTIDNDAVTYAKIQNVSTTSRLLGRASAGAGDVEEITIGSGLTLTGTTISASGGTGSPTAVVTKTADETVTNSTTLQDDDHLFYNFVSGKNYYIRLQLLVSRSSNISQPTLSLAFSGNSDGYFLRVNQTSPVFGTVADGSSSLSTGSIVGFVGKVHPVELIATLKATTDFTGYFRWAQTTLNATSGTVIVKGSQMLIWEFA